MTDRGVWKSSRLASWTPESVLFLIVAVVVVTLIAVPLTGDPMFYFQAAQDPMASEPTHWSTRIGLVLPVWLVSRSFGYSEVAFYTVPVIATAGLGVATAVAGRLLFNRWVGLGAAVLVVASPFVLPYASQVLPDIGAATLVTLAFAQVVRVTAEGEGSNGPVWIAGALFGCAYLMRETSLVFLPALVVFALILRLRRRGVTVMLVSSMAFAVAEALLGLLFWGDPLARLHAIRERSLDSVLSARQVELTAAALERQSDLGSSISILPEMLWSSAHGRILLGLCLALLLGALIGRSRRLLAVLAWFTIPWLLFAGIGTFPLEADRVVIRLALGRYWASFLPPLVLGGLGALSMVSARLPVGIVRAGARVAAVLAVVIGGIAGFVVSIEPRSDNYVRLGNDQYWQLRESLADVPRGATVGVPRESLALLSLYKNDPIGRPIFEGNFHSGSSSGLEWAIVDLKKYAAPDAGSHAADWSNISVHGVDAELSWAILTTSAGGRIGRQTLYQLGPDWQARRVVDEDWGPAEPFTLLLGDLGEGESLVVYDNTAVYRKPNSDQERPVLAGETVLGVFQVGMTSGRLKVLCDFFEVDSPSARLQVPAVVTAATLGPSEVLISLCEAPLQGSGYLVRPVIVVEGPGQMEFGMGFMASEGDLTVAE